MLVSTPESSFNPVKAKSPSRTRIKKGELNWRVFGSDHNPKNGAPSDENNLILTTR
jgi:hypothetical protein